ncbi:MAG: ABC transporter permease [Betaproteobacteria bacterium]|nr:ABC transporter permease [Betaproteobacteria bacterium]
MNLRRVRAVASKEWREIVRDRITLMLAFLMPVMQMVVLGYGMSQDVENVALAVVDEDRTPASRDYLQHFVVSRHFAYRGLLPSARAGEPLLADGRLTVMIVVPQHFEERLRGGRTAHVQTILDGTFTTSARTVRSYLEAINAAASAAAQASYLARRAGLAPGRVAALLQPIRLEVRYLYNQEARSIWAVAPSLIMFILLLTVPLLTALSVVREKESGSIYNVYASTISRAEFVAGKLLPNLLIAALNTAVLWLMATRYFGAPFKGSLALFAAASLLYILCIASLGLLVSLLVRTQQAAMIITLVMAVILAFHYSGMITPISSLEGSSWLLAHLLPPMYYQNAVSGTFLKGVGLGVLWPDLAAFALMAAVALGLCVAAFRKRTRA